MDKDAIKQRLEQIQLEQELFNAEQMLLSSKSNASRSRSVTVGTAFGGVTEISMRGDGGQALWCLMQPVEVIELIHQLAANVGCHINLQPRNDFSSWRGWNVTEQALLHGNGHAPVTDDFDTGMKVGLSAPTVLPEANLNLEIPNRSDEHVVATKKTVNRRSIKRAAKAS